jgi:hypothetical protein
MHDPKQEVPVTIGGRRFTLAYTIGARRRVEAHYGKRLSAVFDDLGGDPDEIEFQIAMFWGCLKRHHSDLALADVNDLVDDLAQAERLRLFAAVTKAIELDTEQSDALASELAPKDPPKAGANGASKKRSATS